MSLIETITAGFNTLPLEEANSAPLLTRFDTKFVLPTNLLAEFLRALTPHYKAMQIQGNIVFHYNTLYFDTPGFDMYLAHHNGRLNRFKIRQRTYQESEETYLEIKQRSNTGRMVKHRLPHAPFHGSWQPAAQQFIISKTPFHPQALLPQVSVNYRRISLFSHDLDEKVTIDSDLEYFSTTAKRNLSTFVVVEIKQARRQDSAALSLLRTMRVVERAFSKYCLGVNCLYPQLKKNRFKHNLNLLNKLVHDPTLNAITGH